MPSARLVQVCAAVPLQSNSWTAVWLAVAAFATSRHLPKTRMVPFPGADRLYAIIFLVVLVSVLLQGGLVPVLARAFRVPTRAIPVRPWSLDIRFAQEPDGLHRHVVAAGSIADGRTVAEISAGDDDWISLISRSGRNIPVRNGTRLQAGDVVLTQADGDGSLGSQFEVAVD